MAFSAGLVLISVLSWGHWKEGTKDPPWKFLEAKRSAEADPRGIEDGSRHKEYHL